jgi:prophage antirepressor-like protein
MTGELILFEGKEVRTFELDGEVWMPLMDLAIAWGLDRTSLIKHVERRPDFFEGCTRDVDNLSTGVADPCINEEGLYLLIARVSLKKIKNPDAKESIIRFRKMVPKLIRKERMDVVRPPLIQEEIDRAKLLAQVTGGDLREFQKIALKKCGYGDYAPALDAIPPLIHGETGQWMNPTDIGQECGLNAREVNSWLYNHDFQYPQGQLWRLTAKGEAYGEEYIFTTTSRHQEIRIRWHRSVLVASGLQKPIAEPSPLAQITG